MRHRIPTWALLFSFSLISTAAFSAEPPQQLSPAAEGVPVSMTVTVEPKHGKEVPLIHKEDVRAFHGKDRLRVVDWVPLEGQNAALELMILIDESSRATLAMQYDDLRHFIDAQPPATQIAVGYVEYGTVQMAQNFTADHEAVGKAFRIPLGPAFGDSSPYLALSDVIKRWPPSQARHAIFLVSSGIDPLEPGYVDPYLDSAIAIAQRTGTQVSAIYASQAGHFGHSFWRITNGQNNLSKLTEETGGESYFQGTSTPISFGPFMDEFADRLMHQFKLTVLIMPQKKPSYQRIRLETEVPDADLVTADQAYVPAAK
jgi:hypothetical protein